MRKVGSTFDIYDFKGGPGAVLCTVEVPFDRAEAWTLQLADLLEHLIARHASYTIQVVVHPREGLGTPTVWIKTYDGSS